MKPRTNLFLLVFGKLILRISSKVKLFQEGGISIYIHRFFFCLMIFFIPCYILGVFSNEITKALNYLVITTSLRGSISHLTGEETGIDKLHN